MFVGILACVLAWLPSSSAVTANAMYSYDSACNSHRYGGEAGNTWFPKGWSNDKIMHGNSDIASDPSLKWVQKGGRAGAEFYRSGAAVRYTVEGVRDGVKMRVVIEPGGEGIITGFPIP